MPRKRKNFSLADNQKGAISYWSSQCLYKCIEYTHIFVHVHLCVCVYFNGVWYNDLGSLFSKSESQNSRVIPSELYYKCKLPGPIYSKSTESETGKIGLIICLLISLPADHMHTNYKNCWYKNSICTIFFM